MGIIATQIIATDETVIKIIKTVATIAEIPLLFINNELKKTI